MYGDITTPRPVPDFWDNLFGTFDYSKQREWDSWAGLQGMEEWEAMMYAKDLALGLCYE